MCIHFRLAIFEVYVWSRDSKIISVSLISAYNKMMGTVNNVSISIHVNFLNVCVCSSF